MTIEPLLSRAETRAPVMYERCMDEAIPPFQQFSHILHILLILRHFLCTSCNTGLSLCLFGRGLVCSCDRSWLPPRSDPSLSRINIQIPINLTAFPIPTHQPLIRLLKMPTVKPSPARTQRTRMHTLQHAMSLLIHLHDSLSSWSSPSQEHNTLCSLCGNNIDHTLCEFLPATVRV